MSQVDDFQNGEEAVAQMAEEAEAAQQQKRDEELAQEPLRPTAGRARERLTVQVNEIKPLANIRSDLPEIHELALSIKERGLLQSPQLRASGDAEYPYELFAGRRRFEAIQILGWESLECDVYPELPEDEAFELMLLENVQRVDLEPVQAARGLRLIMTKHEHETAAELARSLGLSAAWVRKHLKLLDLPAGVRERVEAGEISINLADLLGKAERAGRIDAATAEEIAEGVAGGELSISDAKAEVAPPKPNLQPGAAGDTSDNSHLDDWGDDAPSGPTFTDQQNANNDQDFEFDEDPEMGLTMSKTVDAGEEVVYSSEAEPQGRSPLWAELDAYLLGRVLDEIADAKAKAQLGVSGDNNQWANELPVAERAAKLRELAEILARSDDDAPQALLDLLED